MQRMGLPRIVALLVCFTLAAVAAVNAWQPDAGSVFLLSVKGRFMELDLDSSSILALWRMEDVRGGGDLVPRGRFDGAPIEAMAFSRQWQRLILVIPKEAQTGEDGRREFRLISVRLPDLLLTSEVDVPVRMDAPPSLVMSPDGQRFFMSYSPPALPNPPGGILRFIISVRDVRTLTEISSHRSEVMVKDFGLGASEPFPVVYPDAHFDGSASKILSKDLVIDISGDAINVQQVDIRRALSKEGLQVLRKYEYSDSPNGRPYLRHVAIQSRGGRVLVRVASPKIQGRQALYLVDAATGAVGVPFEVAEGKPFFIGDGKLVAVQESFDKEGSVRSGSSIATGKLLIYEATSGKLIKEVSSPELKGEVSAIRLACESPDGGQLFFASRSRRILRVSVPRADTQEIQAAFDAEDSLGCVFLHNGAEGNP